LLSQLLRLLETTVAGDIFKKQIESGGPILLTNERMERYFMTLSEAAQLVIQASILGKGGELFVLNMGQPYKIIDIIHKLIRIYGYDIEDIPIKLIGLRAGEKLSEELFHEFEKPEISQHERIYVCELNNDISTENYREKIEGFVLKSGNLSKDELRNKIKELI